MTFSTNVFPKVRTLSDTVRQISKKCRFPLPFENQHHKCAQTLFISSRPHRWHNYGSLQRILSLKKSLLVIYKILRLFVDTFTANDKYSLLNRDNLWEAIEMQLSQKQKPFALYFSAVLKSRLNFQPFHTKDELHSQFISEINDSQIRGLKNV